MGNVHIGHDPVVVTQACRTIVLGSAAINRAIFANRIAITNFQPGLLACVLLVLGFVTNGENLAYRVLLAKKCGHIDNYV